MVLQGSGPLRDSQALKMRLHCGPCPWSFETWSRRKTGRNGNVAMLRTTLMVLRDVAPSTTTTPSDLIVALAHIPSSAQLLAFSRPCNSATAVEFSDSKTSGRVRHLCCRCRAQRVKDDVVHVQALHLRCRCPVQRVEVLGESTALPLPQPSTASRIRCSACPSEFKDLGSVRHLRCHCQAR